MVFRGLGFRAGGNEARAAFTRATWQFAKTRGAFWGGPYKKGYSILRSSLGPPILGDNRIHLEFRPYECIRLVHLPRMIPV